MKFIFGVMTPLLLSLGGGALAAPPDWRVTEAAGDVRVVDGGRSRAAARGALLSSGSTITTGANSRAVLVRGKEYVVVSPRSRLRVPSAVESRGGLMQMITDFGTSMFKIEKKSTPHFGVQTPYLAALVKGTTFTVSVGPEGGSVQVTEGAVQVSTLDGGASELVRPGDIATVGAGDLYQLNIAGDVSKTIRSEAAPAGAVASAVGPGGNPAAILSAAGVGPLHEGPAAEDAVITSAVASELTSLSDLTGGLIEDVSTELAIAGLGQQAREAAAVPAAGPAPQPSPANPDPASSAPGQGSSQGDPADVTGEVPGAGDPPGTPSGGPDEDQDETQAPGGADSSGGADDRDPPGGSNDDDKPGKGDNGDKPAKDDDGDKPGKDDDGDKPGKDDDGDKPGKDDDGDRPGKDDDGDKPGKGDDGDKPGKDDDGDKPGKDDDGDKPGKGDDGDKPGKGGDGDKPVKDDDGDKPGKDDDGDKPGKGDDGDKPGKGDDGDKPGKDDDGDKPGKGGHDKPDRDNDDEPDKDDDRDKPGKGDDGRKHGKLDD